MKTRAEILALANAEGGIPIWGCLPGSPASRAGIRYGDILLSVDGQEVSSVSEYLALREAASGEITLVVRRDAELLTFVLAVPITEFDQRSFAEKAEQALKMDLAHPGQVPLLDIN